MDIYLKSFKTFQTSARYTAASYNLYLGSATDQKGTVVLPNEINDAAGKWMVARGAVWFVVEATPKDGQTTLKVADPVGAFNRTVMFTSEASTAGAMIKTSLDANFTNQQDADFAAPYLNVVNSSTVSYFEPELSDGTYNIAQYIKTAVNAGICVSFEVSGSALKITLTDRAPANNIVSFNDGHAQLTSAQFSSTINSKCTVRKPTADSSAYEDRTFYLSEAGDISETIPGRRAYGAWETIVCKADEDAEDVAKDLFSGNQYSHRIEFYSSRRYSLFDRATLMLESGNVSAIISEISISSSDNRYKYACGKMSTTVSSAVQAVNNTISEAAQVGQNTTALAAYPIGSIYMSVVNVSPAALFGGCWERVQGRFLLGASSTYTAGTTGGEAEHTLTIEEMPAHTHSGYSGSTTTGGRRGSTTAGNTTGSTGGGQPHNNMPPYLAVYIWKRTA